MKKFFFTMTFLLAGGLFSAYAQVDTDEDLVQEEELTQDSLVDDALEADSAIIEDGQMIEDRISVDTTEMDDSEDMRLPSDRNRNVPKNEGDE